MNVINWIIEAIENEAIKEDQVVAVYDKNNNIEYLGKAQFAPLNLRQEFVKAETVGNELRINEREVENEEETEMKTSEMMIKKMEELKKRHDDLCDEMFSKGKEENKAEVKKLWREIDQLRDQIRVEQNREIEVGDGVTIRFYSDAHAGTVIRKTKKMIVIQRDKATLDPSFTPQMDVGGFAAHCTNNGDQTYTYERDPEGTQYKAYWSEKEGCYKWDSCRITRGRHEFYDYNF